jgi:gamma-glutamyltranspeptidase/glutathione hydrolase
MAGVLFATAALLSAPTSGAQSPARPLLDYPDIHHPVIGERGMVVAQSEPAARAGAEILRRGGNAVDAAVAVSFVLAVTLPRAGNIGGDGFMLVYLAQTGETIALDYRSVAPGAARADMFLDENGRTSDAARRGHSAAAVPGTVAGLAYAHQRWGGGVPWADLLEPAIRLAEDGAALTHDEAFALRWARERLRDSPESMRSFFRSDGGAYDAGDLLRQPALARTLRLIADDPQSFYSGEIARQIAASMRAHGGLITLEDLAAYRPIERQPLRANYRGYEIAATPPPSGGGVSLVQSLNILENFDLDAMGAGSADATHVLAETMRLAYADRTRYVGDPDFVQAPIEALTSDAYAAQRARRISMRRALDPRTLSPGDPSVEGRDTTHFSIADALGNAVSVTTTLGDSFGAGAAVDGAGFLLNNQMKNFALEHGSRRASTLSTSPANALAPGKRMMSTMTPTMVFRQGRPWLIVGTPGGATIHNTILQILVNVIDHDMNIAEATHAPRIHQQWRGELQLEPGFSPDTVRLLRQRGHVVTEGQTMGSAQSILIEDGLFYGAADPRRPGAMAAPP